MTGPRFRVYIAASLDGFIAPADRSADWLEPFSADTLGFEEFLDSVGPVVMGRRTYDQIVGFGEWPYAGHDSHILTNRPLPNPPRQVAPAADIASLAEALRSGQQDVWLIGGADLIDGFFKAGAVDLLELYVLPVVLGEGVPLFGEGAAGVPLRQRSCKALAGGVAYLEYDVG